MAATKRKLTRLFDDNGIITHKECRGCNQVLPVSSFYAKGTLSRNNIDGYGHRCASCSKDRWRRQAADDEARKRWLLHRIQSKCRQQDIPFNLTIDDIMVPERCPVLGIPLKFGVTRDQSYRGPAEDSPSVDRIDPLKGYVRDNIIVISWRANRIKMNASIDELQAVAAFYRQFQAA